LLNENRAIVSEIAGTTRDTIEEVLNIDGIVFRLIDTAGIRESGDVIEAIGVERSLEKLRTADLVLYLFDANSETPGGLEAALSMVREANPSYLLVGTKSDLYEDGSLQQKFAGLDALYISARTHHHIDVLRARMVDRVLQGQVNTESTVVTNARHYAALQQVASAVEDVLRGMEEGLPGDLLALEIRRCLHFIGSITGQVTNEDQLDYIFSKFCIGK
jgi:tRNA modification GTPase